VAVQVTPFRDIVVREIIVGEVMPISFPAARFLFGESYNVSAIDGEPTGEMIIRPKPKKFPGEQGKPGHSTLCRTLSLKPLRIHRPSVYRAFMVTLKRFVSAGKGS
jgi:hypothetical protein